MDKCKVETNKQDRVLLGVFIHPQTLDLNTQGSQHRPELVFGGILLYQCYLYGRGLGTP